MLTISMMDANDFVQSVLLDGMTYKLHFCWNDYKQQWTMDLRDSQNKDIVRGLAVVPNYPLLSPHRRANVPPGEILAVVVNADTGKFIGRSDFINGKATLVYIPEGERNAILAAAV